MVKKRKHVSALLLFPLLIYGCKGHSNYGNDVQKIVFFCNEIYIDSTDLIGPVNILFKIEVNNPTKNNFYIIANSDIFNRDSFYSNFYLIDTIHNIKYQLLLTNAITPLFPHKKYFMPVLLTESLTWKELMQSKIKKDILRIPLNKRKLITSFLKRSKLVYYCDKRDFLNQHIDTNYFIRDTTNIEFADSTIIHFAIANPNNFLNDSLFLSQHPDKFFLLK